MTQYQATPDYYRDYIEHGWLKDQAAKAHKYIERWRGKNGKWYYRYKSKAQELGTRVKQKIDHVRTDVPGMYENDRGYSSSIKRSRYMNSKDGSRVNAGISAGRKRTTAQRFSAVKGAKNKRTRGKTGSNLTSRGYSGSQGSGESKRIRNTASRRTVRYPWGSNIHRWLDNKGNVITNKVQYTVRGDGKEQNPDYWEERRKRAKKK